MELFRTIKTVEIDKGALLKLSREQALPRLINLKPLKGNTYEVKRPVSFKRGEVIGIEAGNIKPLIQSLEPVKPAGKEPAAANDKTEKEK